MAISTNTASRTRKAKAAPPLPPAAPPVSKLDQLATLLTRDGGATIAELTSVTGWQKHSVRGAIAGALKKRGLTITSDKVDGVRRYQGVAAQ